MACRGDAPLNARAQIVHRAWRIAAAPAAARFRWALYRPRAAQERVLRDLLARNAETRFGRDHGFDRIDSVERYRVHVPLRDYEGLASWIEAAADGRSGVLTRDRVSRFLPTSGTRHARKLIPWTRSLQREFSEGINVWMHGFMRASPAAWRGRAYWSVSPPAWPDDCTRGGIPVGFDADTAYLAGVLRPLVGAALAVPAGVAGLRAAENWRYATLAFLLAAGDLSLISVWSPTFLLTLLEPLAAWWPRLLDDLSRGTLSLPDGPRTGVRAPGRHAARAEQLRRFSPEAPGEIWPQLACISCWTDAAARSPARLLAKLFPRAQIVDKGLAATEGIVSIPIPGAAAPALALTSHFLEFIRDDGSACGAWELEAGREYAVALTTGGGLYRYRLGDRIRVTGFMANCPAIEFIGREGIASDLCGEKLAEPFVRACVERAAAAAQHGFAFALLAPSAPPYRRYDFFFAADCRPGDETQTAQVLDGLLCGNVHYAHARRIGQLGAVRAVRLSCGPAQAWRRYQHRLAADGMRPGDIKPATLDHRADWEACLAGTTPGPGAPP